MSKQEYSWYIEPLDDWTNEVVGKQINQSEIAENAFQKQIDCEDNKPHNLWECIPELINSLVHSKQKLGLRFRIWNQRGNGKIREVTPLYFGSWRKSGEYR